MFCPNCGSENRDTSRFCGMCGARLAGLPMTGMTPSQTSAASYQPPQATAALSPQSTLHGQYYIVKQLGAGGMGRTYIALDTGNYNRQCIVKEMLPNWTTPEEELEAKRNFERECQLLAALNYPVGIPQIFDHFVEGNNFYLVMTFIEGEDLEKRMAHSPGGRLPEKEVIKYALQVCDILIYLASRQPPVIHRDIKPANLIVDKNSGNVMLVDFGIAKATRATGTVGGAINTASWQVLKSSPLGTAGYAPPEQYQGATEPRSDVYALGATMHHLLTGRSPQSAASPFDFPPVRQFDPSLSEGIERVVSHALTMDVTRRPTAAELKAELEAIASPSVVQPSPFVASGPFHFRSGDIANNIAEFVRIAETRWEDGVYHLYQGHLQTWLLGMNRHDLADKAKSICAQFIDQSAGLEEFLRAANPQLRPPVLAVDTPVVDFGGLAKGDARQVELKITNRGRGYLHGTITSRVPWVVPATTRIGCASGATQTIQMKIDTRTLDEGSQRADSLEINTNGGKQIVAAQVHITWVPMLSLKPSSRLDFGNVLVASGATSTRTLTIANAGGGILEGTLATSSQWFTLSADRFRLAANEKMEVQATAYSAGLDVGVYEDSITISSNAGEVTLPAQMGVAKATYAMSSRLWRWGIFAALALVSWFSCSLTFALGPRGILGMKPLNPLGVLFNDLVSRFTTSNVREVADMLGWGTWLFIMFAGLIAWFIAGTQRRALDEIEDFYHRGYLAQEIAPARFELWRYLVLMVVMTILGLALGIRYNTATTRDWLGWGLVIGPFAGALIGGGLTISGAQARGIVNTASALSRFERVFFVTAGMATWGAMLGTIRLSLANPRAMFDWFPAFVWAMVGLVLVSDSLRLPMRLQWLFAALRSGLLVTFIAYMIETSAYALMSFLRYGRASYLALDAFYTRFPGADAMQVVVDGMLVLAILLGGLLGLSMVSDSSFNRRQNLRTIGLLLVPALIVGAFGMLGGSILFWMLTLGRGWSLGVFLSVAALTAGALALFQRYADWLARGESALRARLVHLRKGRPLPNWITRLSLATLARDLTPASIGVLALLTAMLEPLVMEIALSLLLLLMCLGILAVLVSVVIFVILIAARGQTGTLRRTP